MNILSLDEDNVEKFADYITPDIAENIGRTFVRGIVVLEDDIPVAGMVWEIKNMMRDTDNVSNILWLRIDDDDATELLFDRYKQALPGDDVVVSNISLPAKANEREKAALKNAGFLLKFMEGDVIRARLSEIAGLKFLKNITIGDNIHVLKTITQRGFTGAARQFISKGRYGVLEDLAYLSRSYFENDISSYSETDGQITGMFLFHRKPSGALVIVLMAALGGDFKKTLPQMIKCSISNAVEIYSPDTEIVIDRHNYASLALSEKLFPRSFGVPVYIGSRKEN